MYQKIRDLREDKDLTQTQIAKILNCSQRIYSNYKRGEVDIPTQVLIKLAEFHGTSVESICESQMTSSITLIHSSVRLVISCPQK